MRVLIAEDELLERMAMKKFLEDHFNDMEVVAEAANGRMAIELTEKTQPDIIFMDIKMPGINGLEAIEKIIESHPKTKFILVSAYDSFDYAKQAMGYGIKEYILKPEKKEVIIAAIQRVKKEIVAEQQQQAETTQSTKLIKEHFITKLLQHPIHKDAVQIKEKFFPDMKCGFFFVLQSEEEIVEDKISAIFADDDFTYISYVKNPQFIICILSSKVLEKAEVLVTARKIHMALKYKVYIGVGYPYTTLEQLPKSYHEAYEACYQLEKGQNRHYSFVQTFDMQVKQYANMDGLLEVIEKGNDQEAVQYFLDHQALFTGSGKEELYFKIKTIIQNRNLQMPTHSFTEMQSVEEWQKFITLCCLKIQEYHKSRQHIVKAKSFIQENFRKSISLEETALFVDLSPNYFSNLFKLELGETFIDYVTGVRMQHAKQLIEENTYALKEICYMVGYKDPNYFSRVFKKYFGESPKQFQNEIFKK